jgi:hypothetical protein
VIVVIVLGVILALTILAIGVLNPIQFAVLVVAIAAGVAFSRRKR